MNIILFDAMPDQNTIAATDFRAQHIRKILRLSQGDQFTMGVVNGFWGTATITAMDESHLIFSFEKQGEASPLAPVTLLVAQVRPICMKRILREAVSFGIERIVITGADTAERSYQSAKLWTTGEYASYMLDGAMQSGKTSMPSLVQVDSVDKALALDIPWQTKLVLDPVVQQNPLSRISSLQEPVVIAVGPERGWSQRERDLFHQKEFISCTMGSRILRTETACSAAIALTLGTLNWM
jgi:RsmE family RNA methyltransferase